MYSYSFDKTYNLDKLTKEIDAAHIPMISMDLISSSNFIVNTAVQLSNAQQLALNQVVASHVSASNIVDVVAGKIMEARTFGIKIIMNYGAQNILAGYPVSIIQEIMIRTAKVQGALNTGSLYVAINEINAIVPDDSIITVAKLAAVRNQIEDYLGIPRT